MIGWRGPWDITIWRQSPLFIDALRVLAVGILGPLAEELIFRGLLYGLLSRTRLGVIWTIVFLAGFWAAPRIARTIVPVSRTLQRSGVEREA